MRAAGPARTLFTSLLSDCRFWALTWLKRRWRSPERRPKPVGSRLSSLRLTRSSWSGWAARLRRWWTADRLVGRSRAAPFGGIRQHEQVQTGEEEQGEREHRQKAHRVRVLLLCYGDDIDDDGHRKGHGQPAVGLPNPFVPVQCDLL